MTGVTVNVNIDGAVASVDQTGKIVNISAGGPPPPTLQSIIVEPQNATVNASATQQYTAKGVYSDGSSATITNLVTWSSNNPALLSIAAGGLATAIAAGATQVNAMLGSVIGYAPVTVTASGSGPYPGNSVINAKITQANLRTQVNGIMHGVTWAVEFDTTTTQYPRDYNNIGKVSCYGQGGDNSRIIGWLSFTPNGPPIPWTPPITGPLAPSLNPNWSFGVQTAPPGQAYWLVDLPLGTKVYANFVVDTGAPGNWFCEINKPQLIQ